MHKLFSILQLLTQETKQMAIGIFDSDLSGITVLKAVQKQLLDLNVIYPWDHKYAPHEVRNYNDL